MKDFGSSRAVDLFKRQFGYAPAHVVQIPIGVALLGGETEHHQGLALSVAVDRHIHFACAPRVDGRIELRVAGAQKPELFWVSNPGPNPAAPWADPVKAVLQQFQRRKVGFSGFSGVMDWDLGIAPALCHSTLRVATALAVRRLHPFRLVETGQATPPRPNARGELPPLDRVERIQIAKLCQAAATSATGTPGSLLAPMTSLFGKAGHAVSVDFRFLTVENVPLIGETILLCSLGGGVARAELAPDLPGSTTDSTLADGESAACKLGAKSLRSVEPNLLEANRARLSASEYRCARYVTEEIQRAAAGERALQLDDHVQFGQYLYQSHDGARALLRHGSPELDVLVELARGKAGCLGARLLAGSDARATINLVAHHQADEFRQRLASEYERKTGQKVRVDVCPGVDGAG